MSAAFTLDFSGEPVPCSFPRCVLEAFHDGEHEFAATVAIGKVREDVRACHECGVKFVVYGDRLPGEDRSCGSQACILSAARRESSVIDLRCSCLQRPYPHQLSIHRDLRPESYNPKLHHRWPWSLCLSVRLEMSTERNLS